MTTCFKTKAVRVGAAMLAMGCITTIDIGAARAQLVQQYFPTDIPGYGTSFSDSVATRELLENQAQGLEFGGIVIKPSAFAGGSYSSEALGVRGSGSPVVSSGASVRLNSDWTRNAVGATFGVDDHRYTKFPAADFTNWSAGLGGSLTLGNDRASLGYSHLAEHLSATDLGVFGIVYPVAYTVNDVRFGYTKLFGRFSLTPAIEYEAISFGSPSGPNAADYGSLDHSLESGTLTGRYELSTGNAVVTVLRASGAQFAATPGNTANNYTDVAGFVGLDLGSDRVIRYRALVGGESRHFSSGGRSSPTIPVFELDLIWTPTRLDTVTITGVRRLDDPSFPFASNQTVTDGRLQLDHELRRNVYLRGYGEIGESDSPSSVVDVSSRNQVQLRAGVSATWYINRYLSSTLGYGYANSASRGGINTASIVGNGLSTYTSHSVSISFRLSE